MLRQEEGSRAVAEAVALCRPEVISAYPISPQTHIVEHLSDLVRTGDLSPCEYLMVESEFGALSAAIGASATGARTYTATASQGILFMAEALYNASGLGLPIVMTIANRAIGAPINIWNDHSDSMSMRDSGWIQLYAESNQEALDLHIQAFRIAEEISLPVMVCMDGFILTHAYDEVDIPDQEKVDAFVPRFKPRQLLDPADPMTIGAMVGPEAFFEVKYLAHHKQMQALDVIPEVAQRFAVDLGRPSGGLVRRYRTEGAETIIVALGSVLGTIEEVVDEMRDVGVRVGALGLKSFRPFPLEKVREALSGACRVVVLEKALAAGRGGIVSTDIHEAMVGGHARCSTVIAGLGGRAITRESLQRLLEQAGRDELEPLNFLDLDIELVQRELARERDGLPAGPRPRRGRGGGPLMPYQDVKLYQTGTYAVGGRLLDPEKRAVQARTERSNTLTCGHRACQGCGEALGARFALDSAMRATKGKLIAANATGCLEVFSTPYPESSWQLPWIHSLFGNAPAVSTGIAAALKAKGREDIRVVGQGGDGGTLDIGFGCLSGMFERNDDVLFICYDNEAYMNTGVQRSGATPPAARTANTKPVGDEPGNVFGQGKNAPLIAMAHEIPYVATATVAELRDLEYKVEKAMELRGARYLHVFVPCPLGWGSASKDTIEIARLAKETGIFPVFEAEDGEVVGVSKIRKQVAVTEYLKLQKRYAHLFKDPPRTDVIEAIQARADANIRRFGLNGGYGSLPDLFHEGRTDLLADTPHGPQ